MAIYTVWKAKRRGRVHGRNWKWSFWPILKSPKPVLPPDDCHDVTNYERSIINAAESDMARIRENYFKRDAKLKAKYCYLKKLEKEYEEKAPKESQEAEEAKKHFEEMQNKLAELGQPTIKDWVVKLILFLLIITEFPLNALVFSIFGEGRFMTYIMAGVIGLGIPLGAHYVGKVIRQEIKSGKDIALTAIIILFVFIVIVGIAIFRADYLSYILSSYNINIKITAQTAAAIFIGINLFLFFLAVFISYLGTHKNNEEYQKLKDQVKIAFARWKKESKEDIKTIKKLSKIKTEKSKIEALRKCLVNRYYGKAVRLKEAAENLIETYRNANLEVRPSGIRPPCFKKQLTIKLPDDIQLDIKCD